MNTDILSAAGGPSRVHKEGSLVEAPYLSFKSLSRDNVQLSPAISNGDHWTGPTHLLAISNRLGLFAAGRDQSFILDSLSRLRDAFGKPRDPFLAKIDISLDQKPISIKFAFNDERLVVILLNGFVNVYDLSLLRSADLSAPPPLLHVFTHSSEPVRDLQPNPSDKPEIVALLRGNPLSGTRIEMIDMRSLMVSNAWEAKGGLQAQTCISWSPKGKQLVVGSMNGELTQHTPDGTQKGVVYPPESRAGWPASSVIWLENTVFHVVYTSPGVSKDQEEYETYTVLNEKSGAVDISLIDPAPPFGDRSRDGSRFFLHLKDWSPMKHLIVVADPPSTDIGVISCAGGNDSEAWSTLDLDETSRVVLPTDDQGADTYAVGVTLDLTNTEAVSMATFGGDETPPAPPSPILYVYTNIGRIAAYHILNTVQPLCPQMTVSSKTPSPSGSMQTIETPAPIMASSPPAPALAPSSAFGAFYAPSFGQSSFGSAKVPAFGQSSLSPPPSFGTTSFGAATSIPSAFGSNQSQGGFSAFGKPGATGGFSAFGTQTPAFGQTPTPSDSANSPSAFGGLSSTQSTFGNTGSSSTSPNSSPFSSLKFGTQSAFTSAFGVPQNPTQLSTSSSPPSTSSSFGFAGLTNAIAPGPDTFGQPKPSVFSASSETAREGDTKVDGMEMNMPSPRTEQNSSTAASSSFALAPAKGFGAFGSFGSETSAFAQAAQTPPTNQTPAAFSGGSSSFSTKNVTPSPTPAFGAPSVIGGGSSGTSVFGTLSGASKPVFGATSFGHGTAKAAAEPTTTPVSSGGGFSAFQSNSATFASLSLPQSSTPAFAAEAPNTNIFGASSTKTPTTVVSSFSVRTKTGDDDDDEPENVASRFNEEDIINQEPESMTPSGSVGAVFGPAPSPPSLLSRLSPAPGPFSVSALSLAGPRVTDEGDTSGKDDSRSPTSEHSVGDVQITLSPSASLPPLDTSQIENTDVTEESEDEDEEEESTTPDGSPTKLIYPKAASEPIASNPPGASPSTAALVRPVPITATSAPSLGLGRPSSMPSRFGVGSGPFSSIPTRSSPLAASPPISRRDISDSPSPPKPVRAGGGIFTKKAESEPDDEDEDYSDLLKASPSKSQVKASTSPGSGVSSSKTPQSDPALKIASPTPVPVSISAPISDSPKVIPRAKTPPLSSFGFGSSKKAPKVEESLPAFPLGAAASTSLSGPSWAKSGPLKPAEESSAFPKPGLFGRIPSPTPEPKSSPSQVFPAASPTKSTSAFEMPLPKVAQTPKIETTPVLQEAKPGIHNEVNRIVSIMESEIEQLRDIVRRCNESQQNILRNKKGGVAPFDDFVEWSLGDLKALRRRTNSLEDDTLSLEDQSLSLKSEIAELQSLLLKAETNKQEAERFLRARDDKNFAKLLKVRALGPEHLENQTRLRRSIQLVHDRVQQLEDQLSAMKKRVVKARSGEQGLKAPSLDVIARAIANIEAGALEKRNTMNVLTERIEALELDDLESSSSEASATPRRHQREGTPLHDIMARSTITPKVTSATAAALNAERAAARLKSALLSVRSSPLLNITAVPKPVDKARLDKGFSLSLATINIAPPMKTSNTISSPFLPNPLFTTPPPRIVLPPNARLPILPEVNQAPRTPSLSPSPTPEAERRFRGSRTKQHPPSIRRPDRELSPSTSTPKTSNLSFGPLPTSTGPVRNPLMFGFGGFGGTSPATSPQRDIKPEVSFNSAGIKVPSPETPINRSARDRQHSAAQFIAALAEEERELDEDENEGEEDGDEEEQGEDEIHDEDSEGTDLGGDGAWEHEEFSQGEEWEGSDSEERG